MKVTEILVNYINLMPEIMDVQAELDSNKIVDLSKTRTTSQLILSDYVIYIECVKLQFKEYTYFSVAIEREDPKKLLWVLEHFELRNLVDWEMSYPKFAKKLFNNES